MSLRLSQVERSLIEVGNYFAQHGIDPRHITVVGSAARRYLGQIRPNRTPPKEPNDIDILVPTEVFERLAASGQTEIHTLNNYKGPTVIVEIPGVDKQVEATKEWPVRIPKKVLVDESIDMGMGMRVLAPAHDRVSLIEFARKKDEDALAAFDPDDLILKL